MSPGADNVGRCWEAVHARLAEQAAEPGAVVLLHRTGLLARYFDAGGREVLIGLQQAARRPEESPHGVWLLCPGESARDSPRLGTHIVEVTDGSERVVLTREFLHGLRGEPEGAA